MDPLIMTENLSNLLVPLDGLRLPRSFPWPLSFVRTVNEELLRLRIVGNYIPPRFFGYFLRAGCPFGVSGNWTVKLESTPSSHRLLEAIELAAKGRYSISAEGPSDQPEFLLLHDRRDGSCFLWSFASGLRFVEATEAVEFSVAGRNLDRRK
jgi:hypothetical protein